jgi:hypothetical protein
MVLVDSGFTAVTGDTDFASYGIIFENPNPSRWVASSTSVNITFRDSGGQVVAAEDSFLALGLPDQRVALGTVAFDAGEAATMDVQYRVTWEEVDFTTGAFTFTGVKTSCDEFSCRTTATIASSFDEDQESVEVVAIYRDAGGDIIAGDFTYADFVPAGGSVGVEISTFHSFQVATTELYAAP